MGYVKKAAAYLCAALKGMLFIGFSIQILFGICWIWGNFCHVPSYGEPESALYREMLALMGGRPGVLYILQLAAAFLSGYLFLQKLWPAERGFALWRGLAFMTMPFALQCHLSLQPYSFRGSVFLLFLLALLEMFRNRKPGAAPFLAALVWGVLFIGLLGVTDSDRRDMPGYSPEGALACRFAWPTLWNDYERYGEEVRVLPESVVWEATFHPGNMRLFQESLESQVGVEAAREYYLKMAKVGWDYHAPMIIRQMGWDILGYGMTPVIFPLQMAGAAYDSYSGRNYEVMREHTPVLTRNYVDYGCWWFVWMLALSLLLCLFRALGGGLRRRGIAWKKGIASVGICCLVSGLLILFLTMRGAGMMDYRETIAVNELWMTGPLFLIGGRGACGAAGQEETSGRGHRRKGR